MEAEGKPRTAAAQEALGWGAPAAVGATFVWLIAVGFAGAADPCLSVSVAALYLTFAAATVFGVAGARKLNPLLGIFAAVAVSPLYVWQFREAVRYPDLKSHVPIACLCAAVAVFAIALLCRKGSAKKLLFLGSISALCFLMLLGLTFSLSNSVRWTLLKRHTVFGYPAQLALGTPVSEVRTRIWDERVGEGVRSAVFDPLPTVDESSPSIVFVMLDNLRRDALGVYGGDPKLMPELDRIAREAVVVEDVLANASWTAPSIASMFTGLYQEHHGVINGRSMLRPDAATLAELLSGAGYETAAFVTNWGAVSKHAGFDRGFDRFVELRSSRHPYLRADGVTRDVMQWVRERNAAEPPPTRPLFLYVHYLDPHIPYLSGGADSTDFEKARAAYDNEAAFLDGPVAELVRTLETEIQGPVVTLVAADHGEEFGEHGQKGHGYTLYEEVTRVPVFLRTPAGAVGRTDARIEGRDLFHLLLAAASDAEFDPMEWARTSDRSQRYASVSMSAVMPFYRLEYREVLMRAFEQDRTFVIWSALGSTFEVYDRNTDPFETRNIAARGGWNLPSVLAELDRFAPAPWARPAEIQLAPSTEEQLRALGYIH